MKSALAIVTYARSERPNTEKRLAPCLQSLKDSGYEGPVFIVDDGSTCEKHLEYLRSLDMNVTFRDSNGGNCRSKNTAISLLRDTRADDLFLAEDDILFRPGWDEAYSEARKISGIQHFSYALKVPPGHRQWGRQVNGASIKQTTWLNGMFMTMTPAVISAIGGFKLMPAKYGQAHGHWTRRAIAAGLSPYYADILGSHNFIKCNNWSPSEYSSLPAGERQRDTRDNTPHSHDLTRLFYPLVEYSYDDLLKSWVDRGGRKDMTISKELWEAIECFLTPEMETLELGCGLSTLLFAQCVNEHIAVENHKPTYDLASLNHARGAKILLREVDETWYKVGFEKSFDLILIDGPAGSTRKRNGILNHPQLFHEKTIIFVDDVNRDDEARLVVNLCCMLNKSAMFYKCQDGREFAVIK